MLKKRIITAVCVIPLLVAAVWFGFPWFTILLAVSGLVAAFEFYRVVATKAPPLTYPGMLWTLLLIISPHFDHPLILPGLLTSGIVVSLLWLLIHPRKDRAFLGWALTIAGILYIGWLLSYLVALSGLEYGREWLFLAFFANSGSDTAAFFTGRALGKHRLAPNISPQKTWEGAIGGVLGAIAASLILTAVFRPLLSYGQGVVLGLIVSVFGQLGDLVESLFKRNMGIKDTSRLFPGHGGILDRIDSVAFTGVAVYYFALALNNGWLNWL
ncbi:MAG: phosphatidate cytidylyltransferase [Chloroflexota bacterium]